MIRFWPLSVVFLLVPRSCFAAERYVAMFADGSRAEEVEVREWNEPNAQPKIGGRALFDPAVPVRWIIDRQQTAASKPTAYIEFEGGDRLAGDVLAYSEGRENPYESKPPFLIVKPNLDVQPPDVNIPAELRVTTEWVRKIVWEHVGSNELQPSTVWLRTGASIAYRSLRWSAQGIILLTSEGVKEFSFSDLGEIHFPKINPWNAYYEQLAVLSPHIKSRLMQLSGTDGSRWTTSLERFQARHHGDKNRPDHCYQLIQPAWSLDSIWIRYRTIRSWRFFSPHEIPISCLSPVQATHKGVFGGMWECQLDQNIQQGPLQSADKEFGWGFGVQGTSELVFEYPETARAMRTQFGLDRIAETGGCINVEVLLGNGQSVLKQTNLIGSAFVGTVSWQDLPAGKPEQRRIAFRTEMAHEGRPAGADPFDVRDVLNWYEPELRLDPASLESEVSTRRIARLPGLFGWTLSPGDVASVNVANVIDVTDVRDPQFRLTLRPTEVFSLMSRKVKIGSADRWLSLIASRFADNTSPSTVQVRIDGRVFGEFDVPIRQSMADPEPMLVFVQAFQGKTVTVEVVVYPTNEKSWVDWRGFSVTPERPGLLTLFEDDEKLASLLNQGTGKALIDTEKPYSGSRSLTVTPPSVENPTIPGLNALICEHPQLGQYRYVVFNWKKQSGTRIQVQFANHGRLGDGGLFSSRPNRGLRRTIAADERGQKYGYVYERGVVTAQAPFPLWLQGDLPREWQLIQRDLFGDFGLFNVTGLSLNCVDGDAAWFDHFYLARTNVDLEYVSRLLVNPQPAPPKPDGNGMMPIARREDYAAEFSRIAPLFSSLDMAHGLVWHTEQNGQTDIFRTHANAQDKPLILRGAAELPKDRPMMLDLHVSHQAQCDWQLVVRANGQVIHDQLIDSKLTTPQKGWATVQIDLEKFAGQKVVLEVLNQSNNWQNETAFWKRIELIER